MIVVTVVEAVVVECSPTVGKCVGNSGGGMYGWWWWDEVNSGCGMVI